MSQRGSTVKVKRVDECDTLGDLITHCFPAFGGAFLRRIYTILDHAIGRAARSRWRFPGR